MNTEQIKTIIANDDDPNEVREAIKGIPPADYDEALIKKSFEEKYKEPFDVLTLFHLKQKAYTLKKTKNIKHTEALEIVAKKHGFRHWHEASIRLLQKEQKQIKTESSYYNENIDVDGDYYRFEHLYIPKDAFEAMGWKLIHEYKEDGDWDVLIFERHTVNGYIYLKTSKEFLEGGESGPDSGKYGEKRTTLKGDTCDIFEFYNELTLVGGEAIPFGGFPRINPITEKISKKIVERRDQSPSIFKLLPL